MTSLTPGDVQAALDAWNMGLKIHFFETSTATSQLAADNIGCELGQIAKSLCFFVEDRPLLVIASGDQRVDDKKLAAIFDVGRKKIKVATADQCIDVFGYAPGGVPPVGHRTKDITVLLDDSLQRFQQVYAAGGEHNAIFGLTIDQLAQISGGRIADVKKEAVSE